MRFRPVNNVFVGLFCLLLSTPAMSDYPIEVIELKSRPLDEILPVIQPGGGADGMVTGMGNNLVIKASPVLMKEKQADLKLRMVARSFWTKYPR